MLYLSTSRAQVSAVIGATSTRLKESVVAIRRAVYEPSRGLKRATFDGSHYYAIGRDPLAKACPANQGATESPKASH